MIISTGFMLNKLNINWLIRFIFIFLRVITIYKFLNSIGKPVAKFLIEYIFLVYFNSITTRLNNSDLIFTPKLINEIIINIVEAK